MARWSSREKGHPARGSRQPNLGKSFPALCVRSLDEGQIIQTFRSSATLMMPSVTVAARRKRFRCGKRWKRGLRRASWNCIRKRRRLCTARTANRREQLSGATLRFSGLYVSTPTIDESHWQAVRQFLSCGQRQSGQGDARRRASLEAASSQRSRLGENCPMDPSDSCWLGQLLRAFPSFGASQGTAHGRSIYRALGTAEIQKTSGTRKASMGLVARGSNPASRTCSPIGRRDLRLGR